MDITTIKLQKSSKNRLDKLKVHPRESYDEVIQRIMSTLTTCRFNPEKARLMLVQIDRENRKMTAKKEKLPLKKKNAS